METTIVLNIVEKFVEEIVEEKGDLYEMQSTSMVKNVNPAMYIRMCMMKLKLKRKMKFSSSQ